MKCRKCGCTDHDCTGCVERTGRPCHWVEPGLCSACTPRFEVLGLVVAESPAREPDRVAILLEPGGDPEPMRWPVGFLLPEHAIEIHLPADEWAVARRVLPRLAKLGRLSL